MIPKLETTLQSLAGIGSTRLAQLGRLRLVTVSDLLLNRPRRYEDRRYPIKLGDADENQELLARGQIAAHGVNRYRRGTKAVYECVIDDGTARLHCRFWNMPYLESQLAVGMELFVFGKLTGRRPLVMDHPEFEVIQNDDEPAIHLNRIVPIYRLTEGISQRWLRSLVWRMVNSVEAPESSDEQIVSTINKTNRLEQFRRLHFPNAPDQADSARRHFALEELMALQRGFARRRNAFRARAHSQPAQGDNRLIKPFLKKLSFQLTDGQTQVLREIRSDLGKKYPMRRLLHGDVGAGKTVVAACASLMTIESGYTVALMAPTEILAEQHYLRFRSWFEPLGIQVALHTGKTKPAGETNSPALTVGTHALIHEGFQPECLGLVIIDEQHRFGVVQRDKLVRKGSYPHLLVMTATPIPRTLGLTAYGDLDISRLEEMPARRGNLRTHRRTTAELPKIWRFVKQELDAGRQAYIVYPRIDEKGVKAELKSVIEEHDRLTEILTPHKIGLLHGRIETESAQQIMEAFRQNKIQALVSTTVIEVGLDVPNATVMVIENAGQYGLSQLHQLRGRIGRGVHDSHCILVEDSRKADSVERLKVLLRTNDGFEIAEDDLRLRGVGDFLGTRQSGMPKMKFADLIRDSDLVVLSKKLVEQNPR